MKNKELIIATLLPNCDPEANMMTRIRIALGVADQIEKQCKDYDSRERFNLGDRVIYIPVHAEDDYLHPDCENGVIVETGDHMLVLYQSGSSKRTPANLLYKGWCIDGELKFSY